MLLEILFGVVCLLLVRELYGHIGLAFVAKLMNNMSNFYELPYALFVLHH